MADLQNSVAVFGKPYAITRSRLGAITKVYSEQYTCDLRSIRNLIESVGDKISNSAALRPPRFSFLISYDDKTHHDVVLPELESANYIATGKKTERIVLLWSVDQIVDGMENELSVTVRIANPINPLIFLQAALSKSPTEIDNTEFESGSTCVTVNGTTQAYSEEVFLLIQNWISACNKPHIALNVGKNYRRFEWLIDQVNLFAPTVLLTAVSLHLMDKVDTKYYLATVPTVIGLLFFLRSLASRVNRRMAQWAKRSAFIGLFQLTNGDSDDVTRKIALAQNGAWKLIATGVISLALNILAGVFCWYALP